MSEFSAKENLAENSAQFPELDAFLVVKSFSLHEMQVYTSTNGMETSALDAVSAISFPDLSEYSAKNPSTGADLSEYSANLPGPSYERDLVNRENVRRFFGILLKFGGKAHQQAEESA